MKAKLNKMKNLLLFTLLLLAGSSCTSQEVPPTETKTAETGKVSIYQRLDNESFKAKLNDPNTVLLDVRTPGETDRGVIDGAVLLDYRSSDFKEKVAALDKDKTYLVYCQSGGRSGKACTMMQKMGFGELYELKTGYRGL